MVSEHDALGAVRGTQTQQKAFRHEHERGLPQTHVNSSRAACTPSFMPRAPGRPPRKSKTPPR